MGGTSRSLELSNDPDFLRTLDEAYRCLKNLSHHN
jgi:hypothetical protein